MSSKPPSNTGPRANLLVLGSNWINALLPSTLITQADALIQGHKLDDALTLADQQLKKFQGRSVDQDEADELRYVYQRIGFQCLTETQFDDAGKHLFAGRLDPRVLISYYPELCGTLFGPEDAADVYAGVEAYMPPESSIDDIIAINLVRNYSPHLPPNTSTAPPTVELRRVLRLAATDMLKVFLRKWRLKRRTDPSNTKRVNEVVDTVLARLYTRAGEPTDLLALIDGPNDVVLAEIEPDLVGAQRVDALCRLYTARGAHRKLLEAWSRLIAGEWADEDVRDPLGSMVAFLTERRDRALVQEWGVWLLKYDAERAMKMLTSLGTGRRSTKTAGDDAALLRRIQEADPAAGSRFLEHLVLTKRSLDPELHDQLAAHYIDALLACLEDAPTSKSWRAKADAYAASRAEGPFLAYFAATAPDTAATRTRLKTVLFLQGSRAYAARPLLGRLEGRGRELLGLELAVLYGKLGRHHDALRTLVHTVRDAASAEVYCTLGGEVVPPRTAQAIGERYALQAWAALFAAPANTTAAGDKAAVPVPVAPALSREKTADEAVKRDLTKILLEVYMSGGEAMAERSAQLLNAQAVNLDVLDVLALIPGEWPLRLLSSFVTRSLRRTLHARHEGQLVKALSASENLAVADAAWRVLREQGAMLEEALDGDGDDGDGEVVDEKAGEKVGLELDLGGGGQENEKVGLHELHPEAQGGEARDGGGDVADHT